MTSLYAVPMNKRAPQVDFPKGWYCVAESADVPSAGMKPVSWLARELIVYRTPSGAAQVADAYCPHLGAHLASHDGCLKDGAIVCPFHKWRWDAVTGKCVGIPYTNVIPPNVALQLYPTREIEGMVLAWYHPSGAAPDFEPYRSELFAQRKWKHYTTRRWETTCPYRDILENLFDTAHITQLHNGASMPEVRGLKRESYGLSLDYVMDSEAEDLGVGALSCRITGLSLLNQLFDLGQVQTMFLHSFTPIDEERTVQTARLYISDVGSDEIIEQIGRPWIERFVFEVEQDLKVLDYKKHLPRPVLCAGDGPIMKFREYAAQFYA